MELQTYLKPRIESRLARIMELPLVWAYQQQKTRPKLSTTEPVCEKILASGQILRDQSLQHYQNKYKNLHYRCLFQIPNAGVGILWFQDLMQCMAHCGLAVESIKVADPTFYQKWEAFQPDIFISMDSSAVLKSLDLDFIRVYKKRHGLLRLFTPINTYRFPKPGFSREDSWRLELAKSGKTVDAYFSMMKESFFERFCQDWHHAGFPYLCLPFGCNPFIHYPHRSSKSYDYFMATCFGFERVKLTFQYLLPIFRAYQGLWAGPDWRFGLGPLPAAEIPKYYAQSKIVLNPLARFIIQYPAEITERAFTATACGAFQITEQTPITNEFFQPDELTQAKNSHDFLSLFEYYLLHAEDRNAITLKGLHRVYAEHTYFHRIEKLLKFLQQL